MAIKNIYLAQEMLDWDFTIAECIEIYDRYKNGYSAAKGNRSKQELFCATYARYLVGCAFYYGQEYPISSCLSVPTRYKTDEEGNYLLFWGGMVDLGELSGYKGEFKPSTLQDILDDLNSN